MMAIRRGRFHTPAYMSTKGHSVLSQRSYAMPSRTPLSTGVSRASSVAYDTRVEDYLLSERVNNVSYLSNSTLDMTDDTARRSRGRDQQLLRDATQAIVSSESYATPQASVASRRVARGRSLVPRAASVPPRPLYPEAAIIASKLEPDPIKRRRPRSEFAANKYRSMRKEAQESVYAGTPQSSGLYSSVPPLPKPSERKAIRTDDGYSKPKNLLSWQYRLDAKMAPSDLLYQPSCFIRIREQLRDAQERMDRHRQMLDRYLPEGGADTGDVVSSIRRKMADMERRDPVIGGGADSRGATVNVPSSYASGVDPSNPPMSDLRRRIRKTLNKTRNSSVF